MYNSTEKITSFHLAKTALLYIRQSTLRQVCENTESTLRQYALREKLHALGWPTESIIVIDQDLGKSGVDAERREGFQQLVGDVSNGKVGAVACIECSRLSRSSADWGRLTEYCALTHTLLIDADGVYDPNDFNDRLLLGLKGTMSEAELHFLKDRMRGGIINKAKRGELQKPLPIGYVYDGARRIVKDPDEAIRNAIQLFFETFQTVGSAWGMIARYNEKGYKFPHTIRSGFRKGEVIWTELTTSSVLHTLHNPIYAGVYHYGKSRQYWTPEGKRVRMLDKKEWLVFIKDHHDKYIPYEEYEINEARLRANAHPRAGGDKKTPPREGPALLQGLAVCGKCGRRMTVHYYHNKKAVLTPYYCCQHECVQNGGKMCQSINGRAIDEAVSSILLERLTPMAVKAATDVQVELARRKDDDTAYHRAVVDKCSYEASLAQKRYLSVDPENRLVALQLESAWNVKLKELEDARVEYDRHVKDAEGSCPDEIESIEGIAERFDEVWRSGRASDKDKKRMVRHLVEDVTLRKNDTSTDVHVRFKGQTTISVSVANPRPTYEEWMTSDEAMAIIRKEAALLPTDEIAELLNNAGLKSGRGSLFTDKIINFLIWRHNILTLKARLLAEGYRMRKDQAKVMRLSKERFSKMVSNGTFQGQIVRINKRDYMFRACEIEKC